MVNVQFPKGRSFPISYYVLVGLICAVVSTFLAEPLFGNSNRNLLNESSLLLLLEPSGHSQLEEHAAKQAENMVLPSRQHNFTVAICAVMKDVEPYFQEWVDYHLLAVQFDAIYVYDDSAKKDLNRWYQNTRDHPIYSKVEILPNVPFDEHEIEVQNNNMHDCITRFGKRPDGQRGHDYFAPTDIDEFHVIKHPEKHHTIHDVVKEYLMPWGGALAVPWIFFGTANRTVYSPIPVLKRFQYRVPKADKGIKHIVSSMDYIKILNPHVSKMVPGKVMRTTKSPGYISKNAHLPWKPFDPEQPSDVLVLHHYRFMSEKEYVVSRCQRGNLGVQHCNTKGTGLKKDMITAWVPIPGSVFDDSAWKFFTSRVPKYRMYDDVPDFL